MFFVDEWRQKAKCLGLDINLFFEKYEENKEIADKIEDRNERRVGKECRSRWSPYH